ncbi:MAG: bifunctional methylenetetrahydrofolate dehydrogenase/methenyltetrahydrofolate cyclohydrolase [Candidatus Nealsonbacteria bacterium CG10_big_fil_rev_8_21_14_0_10_36_24]|uniref:Bifunctional protein FolD n=1 Tax=Candidatus Nealsonbacteria bacterium CG10_big_fil_rev_8_21_14_0_10_36_24 TaxID=1974710 RepID=A0A2M6NRK4_9BACT|nr:MAG: bifunctional methylenetetrahydrofolate dehydrogenase/methenyltetrahydrofolate cyclohydrolase [Candidatus Nealsonbacteria bacterium CG10_big_fil_rev_8_21_14_0_10_36_24]
MKFLNGRKLADKILKNLKREIEEKQLKLKLAVVLVGENPASEVFIRQKQNACEKIGIDFQLFKFPSKISRLELKKEIEKIVKDPINSGVIIQLPLPKGFNAQEILNLVSPEKDIDVLSEKNIGKFYTGNLAISPPTTKGIRRLLKEYKISVKGKNVVLVGAGRLVGRPLAVWLLNEKTTVSIVDEFTKDISYFTKRADIIISGVGKPNLITGKTVKRGVAIIDVGIFFKRGKAVGDVELKTVSQKADYITPTIGGVGPMTVACLLQNLVELNAK